jgi:transposase
MPNNNHSTSGEDGPNWSAYNAAQINEKPQFIRILHELCKEVEEPMHTGGRKPFQLKDVVFCLVYSIFTLLSTRRSHHDLVEAQFKGLIAAVPSPSALASFMRLERLTAVLKNLITKSCLPLAGVEKTFAADSTGLSLPRRLVWFNPHTKRRQKRRAYIKLHILCGTRTNIITAAEVSEGKEHDAPFFKRLLEGTARYFEISEVSADGGYLSGDNMNAALMIGAIPYIAFRKDCALNADYKSTIWKDLLYLFKTRDPLFTDHYFLRNNVEATFHSLKTKFGGQVRSKSSQGQVNEALCKVLCHNICTLAHAIYELGIDPTSWSEDKITPRVTPISIVEAMAPRVEELRKIRDAAGNRELPPEETLSKRFHKPRKRLGKEPPSGQFPLFE